MEYKMTVVHKLLVVYRTVRSLRAGCIYQTLEGEVVDV
jgi:hypothetical protein